MGVMEELNERIKNSEPSFISRAIQPTFDWNTSIGYLQHCADNELGEPVDILTYRLPVADQVDSIRPVTEYLSENIDGEILGTDLYVTLSTVNAQKYTSKNDSIVWITSGDADLTYNEDTRYVTPGDLLFVPRNNDYIMKAKSALAFVVFSLR